MEYLILNDNVITDENSSIEAMANPGDPGAHPDIVDCDGFICNWISGGGLGCTRLFL